MSEERMNAADGPVDELAGQVPDVAAMQAALDGTGYLADEALATALFLAIRLAEARGETLRDADLFSEEYLLARPLLAALDHPGPRPAVLLIDEADRGDDA